MRSDVCFCRPFPAQTATASARELSVGTGVDILQLALLPTAQDGSIPDFVPPKKAIPICFKEPKTFNYTTN